MLKIAICDDDRFIGSEIEKILLDFNAKNDCHLDIELFYSGESLIKFMKNEHHFDLIFLDIELGTSTGVEIGKIIRLELDDYVSKIVFVSATSGYDRQLFSVQPFGFIEKPVTNANVIEFVNLAIKVLNKENLTFTYKYSHETNKVEIKNILYFESDGKKIKIVTTTGEKYFYGSLCDVQEKLPDIFISPHRSYLVNYNNIEKITSSEIHIQGLKDVIPISRNKIKEVQSMLIHLEKERLD